MTRENVIWHYMSKIASDASKAQCNECKKVYSLGSDKPKTQTTHGLKKHLEKCHPELYSLYLAKCSEIKEGSAAMKRKLETSEHSDQDRYMITDAPQLIEGM